MRGEVALVGIHFADLRRADDLEFGMTRSYFVEFGEVARPDPFPDAGRDSGTGRVRGAGPYAAILGLMPSVRLCEPIGSGDRTPSAFYEGAQAVGVAGKRNPRVAAYRASFSILALRAFARNAMIFVLIASKRRSASSYRRFSSIAAVWRDLPSATWF